MDWRTKWALLDGGKLYEWCAAAVAIDPSRIPFKPRAAADAIQKFNTRHGSDAYWFELDLANLSEAERERFGAALELALTGIRCGALNASPRPGAPVDEFTRVAAAAFAKWAQSKPSLISGMSALDFAREAAIRFERDQHISALSKFTEEMAASVKAQSLAWGASAPRHSADASADKSSVAAPLSKGTRAEPPPAPPSPELPSITAALSVFRDRTGIQIDDHQFRRLAEKAGVPLVAARHGKKKPVPSAVLEAVILQWSQENPSSK